MLVKKLARSWRRELCQDGVKKLCRLWQLIWQISPAEASNLLAACCWKEAIFQPRLVGSFDASLKSKAKHDEHADFSSCGS